MQRDVHAPHGLFLSVHQKGTYDLLFPNEI